MTCYEPWTCSRPFEQIELSDFNSALRTALRRSTSGQEELQLVMVRIYKSKASASPAMFFGAELRQQVMFILFDILHQSEKPMVMLGNFGMPALSTLKYCQEYDLRSHGATSLKDRSQILANSDDQVLCLSIRTPSCIMVQVEQEICPARIFAFKHGSSALEHADGHLPKQRRKKLQ